MGKPLYEFKTTTKEKKRHGNSMIQHYQNNTMTRMSFGVEANKQTKLVKTHLPVEIIYTQNKGPNKHSKETHRGNTPCTSTLVLLNYQLQ